MIYIPEINTERSKKLFDSPIPEFNTKPPNIL